MKPNIAYDLWVLYVLVGGSLGCYLYITKFRRRFRAKAVGVLLVSLGVFYINRQNRRADVRMILEGIVQEDSAMLHSKKIGTKQFVDGLLQFQFDKSLHQPRLGRIIVSHWLVVGKDSFSFSLVKASKDNYLAIRSQTLEALRDERKRGANVEVFMPVEAYKYVRNCAGIEGGEWENWQVSFEEGLHETYAW